MRRLVLSVLLLSLVLVPRAQAYRLEYREQLWELFHLQLYYYPERIAENVVWLQQALEAPFANPLYALAEIQNETEWEKYRYLFTMHIYVKLVDMHILWASKFFKLDAFFFNYPWREDNLRSIERAEELLSLGLLYWEQAVAMAREIERWPWVHLEELAQWEDEAWRINTGDLDYEAIIGRHLDRLSEVRERFENMDESIY